MKRPRILRWFVAVGIALMVLVPSLSAWATPAEQIAVTNGMVVALQGTPHLFIGDEQGVLHWGGDTRGLAGHFVDWPTRREVTLDQLRGMRRGDPWLSAGLLKDGDPIYLVKWETDQPAPTLLHIQSIADVELFGINTSNYGAFVMTPAAWQQRFGINPSTLTRGELTSPIATPTPVATATPANRLSARLVETPRSDDNGLTTFRYKFEITDAPNTAIRASLERDEYNSCNNGCSSDNSTNHDRWGPIQIGTTDSTGKLTWTDEHKAYKSSTYTFTEPAGGTATVTRGSDV
jgi:hypothetical protein